MNQRKAGAVLSYAAMGITIISNFIYVPLLLHFVTQEEYGVYQIMGSIIAYMSVMDFGLSNTIIRYYSGYLASGDKKDQENILAVSMLIYGVITVFAAFISILIYPYINVLFGQSFSDYELRLAKRIYIIFAVNILLMIPANVFSAVIQSHEKYIFFKGIQIMHSVLQPVLILAVISKVPDIVLIAVIQLCFNVANILLNIYYCVKKIGIKIKLHYLDKDLLKKMMRFAFFIFLGTVVDQINMKTDHLILGAAAGAAVAAVYSVSAQLQMAYMNFSTAINNVFLPKISMISARTDSMEEMNQIFLKVGRLQLFIILYIYGGFIVLGERFITDYWVGEAYKEAYAYTAIVMTSILIPLSQNTGIFILQAKNKHEFRAVLYSILAIVHLTVSACVAGKFGGLGCAIVMAAVQLIGNTIIMNVYYQKKIGIDICNYYKNFIPMILFTAMCIASGFMILQILPENIAGFLCTGIAYSALYCILFVKFVFNDYEKQLFLKKIGIGKN